MESITFSQTPRPLPKHSHLSQCQAFLFYVNVGLGVCLVVAPLVWYYEGLLFGLIAQIIGALMVLQASHTTVRLSLRYKAYTAQDLALKALGPRWASAMVAIQMFGLVSLSVTILYIAASTLQALLYKFINRSIIPDLLSHILCVLFISGILLPFVLKKEVKELNSAALLMFISLLILIAFLTIFAATNFSAIHNANPQSDFYVPLWPQHTFTRTFGKFFVLFSSPCCLQTAFPILHSQSNLTFKAGFLPILWTVIFIILALCAICIPQMLLFGSHLLRSDNIFALIGQESDSFVPLLISIFFVVITMFNAPVFLFSARETVLHFVYTNFPSSREIHPTSPQHELEVPLLHEGMPIKTERVKKSVFYGASLLFFAFIVIVTILLRNLVSYLELIINWWLFFINIIFPNLTLLYWKGLKGETMALLGLIAGVASSLLSVVAALVDLSN